MKVASVPKTNLDACVCGNSNVQHQSVKLGETPKDSVSFSGVKDKATGLFKWIDKQGFFVEFLIVDTISMICPRVLVGLNRDRDKTGQYNYKAAAEEAGREILSGPSMNLIPMGILAAVSAFKPASHMNKGTLGAFAELMNKVIDKSPSLSKVSKDDLNTRLANQLFDESFGHLSFANGDKQKLKYKQTFTDLLVGSTKTTKKFFNTGAFDRNAEEFESVVTEINNKGFVKGEDKASLHANSVNLCKNEKGEPLASLTGKELYEDFHNYSKDVMSKLSELKFGSDSVKKAKDFVRDISDARIALKTTSAIAAFFAVGTFLLYLPKLYQQGKVSPAEESAKRAKAEGGTNENK